LGCQGDKVQFPVGAKDFYLLHGVQRPALRPAQTGSVSLGIKWPGHEADHSPPSIVEVKKCGAVPPLPHMSSWRGA
jgi:hypothetical protein